MSDAKDSRPPVDSQAAIVREERAERFRDKVRSLASAALAGIAFGVLTITGLALLNEYPSLELSDEELTAWFDDGSNRGRLIAGLNLMAIASVAFLWFMAVIRRRLGEREDRFFASVFFGSGLVATAVYSIAAAAIASPGIAMTILGGGSVDGETASLAAGIGGGLMLVVGPRLQAVFVLTASTLVVRSEILPRWLAYFGYFIGLGLFLVPIVATPAGLGFPIWVFVFSVVLLYRRWQGDRPEELAL